MAQTVETQEETEDKRKLVALFWIIGDAPLLLHFHERWSWFSSRGIIKLLECVFRGVAQVCFANNPFTGFIILTALGCHDIQLLYGALLATSGAFLMSQVLKQPDKAVVCGLQTYCAVLIGTVTVSLYPIYFQKPIGLYVWIGIFLTSTFSVCIGLGLEVLLSKHHLPIFTLPFNIMTCILFLAMEARHTLFGNEGMGPPANTTDTQCWAEVMGGVVKSAGQVYAVEGIIPSVLILCALLINSPLLTLISFTGGLVASLTAQMFAAPHIICKGVWGYNGFLAAGSIIFFVRPRARTILVALLNAMLSALIQVAIIPVLATFHLPVFTLPFCLSSVIMLSVVEKICGLEKVVDPTYPEEHYLRHHRDADNTECV